MILASCHCCEATMRKCMLNVWYSVQTRVKHQWLLALLLLTEHREPVLTSSHSHSTKNQSMAATGIGSYEIYS